MMSYKYLFGPVQSRRLGRSLGVDCVPAKVCNLDCVYCECGPTTNQTMQRTEYVPFEALCAELNDYLKTSPAIDVLTLTGSGEPLLYSRIGDLIQFIKHDYPQYKIALLTNGTLLSDPAVRQSILMIDYALPNLDAVSSAAFGAINQPHPDLDVQTIVDGIVDFSHEFSGTLWLEVFIVPGVNDSVAELAMIKSTASKMRLARVQINSLDRPCADAAIMPASPQRLQEIAQYFFPLPVEIIARSFHASMVTPAASNIKEIVLSTVERRPLTAEDISVVAGITVNAAQILMAELAGDALVLKQSLNGLDYITSFKLKLPPDTALAQSQPI